MKLRTRVLGSKTVTGDELEKQPRLGVIGADVPRQLVLACGAVPVRIYGAWSGEVSQETHELIGAADAVAARVLNEILTGVHDGLDGLVICNDSMAHLRIYYVLRVLAERGRVPFPIHFLDTPRGNGPHLKRFLIHQYANLAAFIAGITGQRADRASFAHAAVRESALGQALQELTALRKARSLNGTTVLETYRAASQLSPEEASNRIGELICTESDPDTSQEATTSVFMTGSSHPDAAVYSAIENTGVRIVGEDHDVGESSWIGEVITAEDLEKACRALADRHIARPPAAARSLSAQRTQHFLKALDRSGATGVVALVREFDDGPVWDLAEYRPAIRNRDIWLVEETRVPASGLQESLNRMNQALASTADGKETS